VARLVGHDEQDQVPDARGPDPRDLAAVRRAPRGRGPGQPRHLPGRPRRRRAVLRDHRGRYRPQRRRAGPQGEGRPVRPQPPRRGLPRQVGGWRGHPGTVVRPGGQDLMLNPASLEQRRTVLANLREPIDLVSTLDASPKGTQMGELLDEVAGTSDLVTHVRGGDDRRRPSFRIVRAGAGEPVEVTFAGSPLGHEFPSLILALLHVSGHPPRIDEDTARQIADLDADLQFETYMSLSCQNCPDVVQALNIMSVLNPRIGHVAIEGGTHPDEVEERNVQAVPTVYL